MRKLSARWVPRLLTPDNKRTVRPLQSLTLFKRNPKKFLSCFVTVDETWIHWYTPETKEQSKQWTSPGEPAAKKAKTVPSAGKVRATVFWDSQSVIHIDYLTGLYYAELLVRFAAELQKIRPHLAKKKVLFHHKNAPAHTSALAKAKLVSSMETRILEQLAY